MNIATVLWLIPVAPLLGAIMNGIAGKAMSKRAAQAVAMIGPLIAFALSILAFLHVRKSGAAMETYFQWMAAGDVTVGFGLQVDRLTAVMLLVVTGVGSVIHFYSIEYMHEDGSVWRFFSYLNLFLFAMLLLVMGDSLPVLFVGWEGVGLCSYLLIGYFYKDLANADAGKKAFIVNRIGDAGFLLGMFALFALVGSLGWADLQAKLGGETLTRRLASGPFAGWTAGGVLEFAGICLFIGATGKSAQIPLYVWLPDAMAGPTPVSALIHAATMVTAGVYMMARLNFLYVLIPHVLAGAAVIAAATAILSAVIAVAQTDIKKVLAYSTISQLGFMFCGVAATAFATGMFHLVTHAFFKALLFLGAGAVIHALHGEQDIRKMGGLAGKLRGVLLVFAVGGLALAGCYGFSGFFSKDAILGAVVERAHAGGTAWTLVWWMLISTAALTAFYTTRLILLVFFGPPAREHHPHPPGFVMMSSLVLLAVLSAVGGLVDPTWFLKDIWPRALKVGEAAHHHAMMWSIGAFVLGAGGGILLYGVGRGAVEKFTARGFGKALHNLVWNKFYVDEIYTWLVVNPLKMAAAAFWFVVDKLLIDTVLVGGAGKVVYLAGGTLRRGHSGAVNAAAAAIVLGALGATAWLLYRIFLG